MLKYFSVAIVAIGIASVGIVVEGSSGINEGLVSIIVAGPEKRIDNVLNGNLCVKYMNTSEIPEYPWPDGAWIDWIDNGYSRFDRFDSIESPLVLAGPYNALAEFEIEVDISIGAIRSTLYSETISLSRGENERVPLPLEAAFRLHPEQRNYVTSLWVVARIESLDGEKVKGTVVLEPRYLAPSADGSVEILDETSRDSFYPFGYIQEQGQEAAWRIFDEAAERGEYLEAISPGVFAMPVDEHQTERE